MSELPQIWTRADLVERLRGHWPSDAVITVVDLDEGMLWGRKDTLLYSAVLPHEEWRRALGLRPDMKGLSVAQLIEQLA